MQPVKILRINLKTNEQSIPDTFKLENYAVQIILDYSGCGVEGKRKFVDLQNASSEKFRYDLGNNDVVSFYLTNDMTHASGEILINPIAMQEIEIQGTMRNQLIGFKTYRYFVKDSITAYDGASGGEGVYDDVIIPIQKDVINLYDLIDKHRQRIEILETLSGEGEGEYPDLASWLLAMQTRIDENEIDISSLFNDISDFDDILSSHTLQISEQVDNIDDLGSKYNLLSSDLDGFSSTLGSIDIEVEKIIQDFDDIGLNVGPLSIPGPPGFDGISQYPTYVWIKFADTPTTGMASRITDKSYIGYAFGKTLRKPPEHEDDNYSDYVWQLIGGDSQSIYDRDDVNGYERFIWVKFANNEMGEGFSNNPLDKMYIGFSFDNLDPEESDDYKDYSWYFIPGYFSEQLMTLNKIVTIHETRIEQTEQEIVLATEKVNTHEDKIAQMYIQIDEIMAEVGSKVNDYNRIPNLNGDFDNYMFWDWEERDTLTYETNPEFALNLQFGTAFELKDFPESISGKGLSFFANTESTTGLGRLVKNEQHSFRTRRIGAIKPFTVIVMEYDEDEVFVKSIPFLLNSGIYEEFSFMPHANSRFARLTYQTTGLSLTNRLELTETMFNYGDPMPWQETPNDLKVWTLAQLSIRDDEISLKVSDDKVISAINLTSETAKIEASKINLVGIVKVSDLTDGTTTISGNNITTGTISASRIDFDGATGTNVDLTGKITASSGKIGRFTLDNENLLYRSDLFDKDYDNSDLAKVREIIETGRTPSVYEKYVYDLNGDGQITLGDLAMIKAYLLGNIAKPIKKIRSEIRLGTNSGEIRTSAIAQNGAVGPIFIIQADKMVGDMINAKGIATVGMVFRGKEVSIDSNGFLKAS